MGGRVRESPASRRRAGETVCQMARVRHCGRPDGRQSRAQALASATSWSTDSEAVSGARRLLGRQHRHGRQDGRGLYF